MRKFTSKAMLVLVSQVVSNASLERRLSAMRKFTSKAMLVLLLLVVVFPYAVFSQDTDEEPIRILATVAFSGVAGNIGPGYDKAMRLAIDEINAMGIDGFSHIEYKVIDTETSPSALDAKLRREVMTWHPDVVGGTALETTTRVLSMRCPEYKLPSFQDGHMGMTKFLPPGEVPLTQWLNYYGYSTMFAAEFAVRFFQEMGAEKVAFFAGDYDWGYDHGLGMKYAWEKYGRPFEIAPVMYVPLGKTDYSAEIQIIKQEAPDAIFVPYSGAGWFSLAKQLRDAGAMPRIVLYGATYSNLGAAKVTGEYGAEGIYCLADHDPTTDVWRDFVRRWKDAYGEQSYPDAYANNYYQMMYWIKEVFEEAQTKDPETILQTMREVSFQNVSISPMGPMGPSGANLGAKGAVIQFLKGSSKLDPSFGLHPVLVRTYQCPDTTALELLDIIKDLERLQPGERYPAE